MVDGLEGPIEEENKEEDSISEIEDKLVFG